MFISKAINNSTQMGDNAAETANTELLLSAVQKGCPYAMEGVALTETGSAAFGSILTYLDKPRKSK